jgi:hypothetical protein
VAVKAGADVVKTVVVPADSTVKSASNVSVTGALITGLTNGTSYTFVVSATNAIGSTAAAATAAVMPYTAPGAPTDVVVTGGNATLNVSWAAPASNGGYAISGYTVTYTPTGGQAKTVSATTTSAAITKLVNGTTYSVTVQAKTANKDTKANLSAATTSVASKPSTVPVAPKTVTGVAGTLADAGKVTVSWTLAADTATVPANGGSAITGYDIVVKAGATQIGEVLNANQFATSKVITGLTKGTSYTFTVTAKNANGSSVAKVSAAVKSN